jgi:hypothetical protein
MQAVLDVNHNYNYTGRSAGDLVSAVVRVHLPTAGIPTLTLSKTIPGRDPWAVSDSAPAASRKAMQLAREHASLVHFVSPSLSAFWGRPITMRGRVLTPPGYDAKTATRYPTVYYTQGFGGNNDRVISTLVKVYTAMVNGQMGIPGRIQSHRDPRIRRLGQQRSLGARTDHRADSPPGVPLPYGRP